MGREVRKAPLEINMRPGGEGKRREKEFAIRWDRLRACARKKLSLGTLVNRARLSWQVTGIYLVINSLTGLYIIVSGPA